MKKIQLLVMVLCLNIVHDVTSSSNLRYYKFAASSIFAAGIGTNLALHGYTQYQDNIEYAKTQEKFAALGIEHINKVTAKNPAVLVSTQKYHEEIASIIEQHDRLMTNLVPGAQDSLSVFKQKFQRSDNLGLRKDLSLRHINHEKGYGVVATRSIPKNTPIGSYTGQVCHTDEIENHDYAFDSLHVYEVPGAVVIGKLQVDARDCGNITRFVNHDESANCQAWQIMKDEMPHIVFVTNRNVAPGEELTIDYGPKYKWNKK